MDPLILLFVAGAVASGAIIWKSFPSESGNRSARVRKTEDAAREATGKAVTRKEKEQARRAEERSRREREDRERRRAEENEGDAVGIGTGVGGVAGDVIGLGDGMKD